MPSTLLIAIVVVWIAVALLVVAVCALGARADGRRPAVRPVRRRRAPSEPPLAGSRKLR